MANEPYPTQVLAASERVAPVVLGSRQRHPVDLPSGALPRRRQNQPEEIVAAYARAELPAWAARLPRGQSQALDDALRMFRWQGAADRYRFSLWHRLDERTLIGLGPDDALALLTVTPDHPQVDPLEPGPDLLEYLHGVITGPHQPGNAVFRFEPIQADRLPEAVRRHHPQLVVEARWRMVSAFSSWVVGAPAGAVSLTPGETRILKVTASQTRTRRSESIVTIVEKSTREATQEFNDTFARKLSRSLDRGRTLTWSAGESGGDPVERTRSSGGQATLSVKQLLETTEQTVRSLVLEHTQERSLTLVREDEYTEVVENEREQTRTLSNKGPQPVTYLYHQLDAAHRVLVELVDLSLVYTGARLNDGEQVFDLRADWGAALASLVGDTHAAASQTAVAALLKSEFGPLDCLDDSGALPRLRPVPDPDDAMRIDLREALMGARRSSGALPLTLGNETVDLRTPYLHVEARVPQHGVIVPPK